MPLRTKFILIVALLGFLAISLEQWRRSRIEHSQDENILAAARRYGIDAALVKAVIWRESRFNPGVRGGKGEVGLMQIMPDTTGSDWAGAKKMAGYDDAVLLDPVQNIDCGSWYLRKLLGRYQQTDDPIPYALADYNAGRRNALRWMTGAASTNSAAFIEQIGFPSTRNYVRAVIQRRQRYIAWAAGQGSAAQSVKPARCSRNSAVVIASSRFSGFGFLSGLGFRTSDLNSCSTNPAHRRCFTQQAERTEYESASASCGETGGATVRQPASCLD